MDDDFVRLAKLAMTAAAEADSDRLTLSPNGYFCIGDWQIGSKAVEHFIEREALISYLTSVRAATYRLLKNLGVEPEAETSNPDET